ncbi:GntR family transcriptional regulator [Embleya sp. AB8]|uniref:GntR family transcriptional regulator n=1 Tax=Embleya sp. AB8 TaxID=3156304 RepID=UPI003C7670CD
MEYDPDAVIIRDAPEAPFEQLAGILRARVRRGDWKSRRPIPAESRLCDEYELSRPTVRRAIAVLVADGVLFVVQGRGTYVQGAEPTGAEVEASK